MQSNPCKVCGGTEINLVDGFYYCAECGTQDVNVQQTLIEQTMLADGTIAFSKTKKITKILKDKIKMSGEWYKWHAFNFILAGLTEELLSLGAKESVKKKIFWIWTKYILKFQVKDDSQKAQAKESSQKRNVSCQGEDEEDPEDYLSDEETKGKNKEKNMGYMRFKIHVVTHRVLVGILYVALNLDRSDIQLTDLHRFIFEERLSIQNCTKFVPKEIDTQSIPHWKSLINTSRIICSKSTRQAAMLLFKQLELGVPIVPDLTKIIDKYIKELCLPLDFRDFVLSLTHIMPVEFLQIDLKSMKSLNKIPDYECACMSYILLGLKICFGLDSDYEIRLSDIVDKINEKENYLKSYKLGFTTEPTGRLFSFQEWCSFIQFRKIVICNNYSLMAKKCNFVVDDSVLMELLGEKSSKKPSLRHEVTMNIINKIPLNDNFNMIPIKEFPATMSPFTAYTEIILDHTQDPDLRLLLCEDFTQYSMKYATEFIGFAEYGHDSELIVGVNDRHKIANFSGELFKDRPNRTLVFVRNCENKNWLETKRPDIDHITKIENDNKDNDHGYESISESPSPKIIEVDDKPDEIGEKKYSKCEVQLLEEEFENISIFDDDFKDVNYKQIESNDKKIEINDTIVDDEVVFEFNNISRNTNEHPTNFDEQNDSDDESINPEKIDKAKLIQLLIENACKIYKIPKPREKIVRNSTAKRKSSVSSSEHAESKRRKYETDQNEFSVNKIISSYYEITDKDILNQVSEQVKLCIQNVENTAIDQAFESKIEESEINFDNCPEKENEKLEEPTDINEELNNTELASNAEDSEEENQIVVDKGDPEFDKETHNVKQLYVRLDDDDDDFNIEDNLEMDDPVLNDILDKQIKELSKRKFKSVYNKKKELKRKESDYDSDDDIPLSVLQEEKNSFIRNKNSGQGLEPLINNLPITNFNIWLRNYSKTSSASSDADEFDLELNKNFPASFTFIIQECASMVNCTSYVLYKGLLTLELNILGMQKTARKKQNQMQKKQEKT